MSARQVLLANPSAFCAGVERAIRIVEHLLEQRGAPIYVRKEIVHNTHIVADLRARGAVFVDELDEVPDDATVVFSAHGVSPAVREEAERRALRVVDATCPLVSKVHAQARRLVDRGNAVVLIGHRGHEEADGILGEAPDRITVVATADEVAGLDIDGPVSYVTQTTLAADEVAAVVDALRERFPHLTDPDGDGVCYATTNRQAAARVVAEEADLVLVLGSRNSSNSNRLVEVARRRGARAHLVDDVTDVDPAWLDGASTVGITAGASVDPSKVDELVDHLSTWGPVEVSVRRVAEETITFTMPKEVDGQPGTDARR